MHNKTIQRMEELERSVRWLAQYVLRGRNEEEPPKTIKEIFVFGEAPAQSQKTQKEGRT